eukprot:TRINITY_DN69957_c0_g1_i1.p1 TRINITY_DN69957_c0_g1~~TRINITY_DN69957_c0_g1_i1.p1  ORF type:complete len:413 (-),score=47.20 TRINITY_DN69957_c0_g1_i1:135-1373(-)
MIRWLCFLGLLASTLSISSFFYSWSAWKLDAKKHFGWQEGELSTVFALANLGQNFAVHLGLFYDKRGAVATCLLAAGLKVVGQLGMRWCYEVLLTDTPAFLFGTFFFLDTQATVLVIIMAQCEAQKASPPSRAGTSASVCTAAFGAGAILWVTLYDRVFAPQIGQMLVFAGLACGFLLLLCALVVSASSEPTAKATTKQSDDGPVDTRRKLQQLLRSQDFISFFACTLIAWGIPMVWVANAASFSKAAELENGAAIRSAFFTASLLGRMLCGPVTDAIQMPRPVWLLATQSVVLAGAAGMLATAGAAMYPLACLTGLAFGFITTLVPMECKAIDASMAGTLYAISKVGAMLSSTAWTFIAGHFAQKYTAAGEATCVGAECYRWCWVSMLVVAACLSVFYVPWGRRALRKKQQ